MFLGDRRPCRRAGHPMGNTKYPSSSFLSVRRSSVAFAAGSCGGLAGLGCRPIRVSLRVGSRRARRYCPELCIASVLGCILSWTAPTTGTQTFTRVVNLCAGALAILVCSLPRLGSGVLTSACPLPHCAPCAQRWQGRTCVCALLGEGVGGPSIANVAAYGCCLVASSCPVDVWRLGRMPPSALVIHGGSICSTVCRQFVLWSPNPHRPTRLCSNQLGLPAPCGHAGGFKVLPVDCSAPEGC